MQKRVRNRLLTSLGIILIVAGGIYVSLYFLSENIVFFVAPSEVTEKHLGKKIMLGGLVENGSVKKSGAEVAFNLMDGKKSIQVKFRGILPALFRESQGIVAEGRLENGVLLANRLLTKHDENYRPPENYNK